MNKFKNLAKKLIQNPLWTNKITFYQIELKDNGVVKPKEKIIKNKIEMMCVISKVSKNLVDNEKIFNTDQAITIDSITLIPNKEDIIEINGIKYKIVMINPLGLLDNEPTAYEIIMRQA